MLDQFNNPPAQYRIAPVWQWNTVPAIDEVLWQIREMHSAGASGFFIVLPFENVDEADSQKLRKCIDAANKLAGELGIFAEVIETRGAEHAQVCALKLYKTAQEPAIGNIVNVPIPNAGFAALQINAGWTNDIRESQILREKLGVSAAHSAGIKRILCSPFADVNWDASPIQLKSALDLSLVLGTNFFAPSPFLYTSVQSGRKNPLPSLFYQSTFWKDFGQISDYAARLSYALSLGSHKAQVALFNPINTIENELMHDRKGKVGRMTFDHLKSYCENLLGEHIDYDIISDECIAQALNVDQRLIVKDEAFAMLVLPPCTCIKQEAALKIAEFVEDGGAILATNLLPFKNEYGESSCEISDIFGGIFEVDPASLYETVLAGELNRRPVLSHNSSNVLFYQCEEHSELKQGLRGMVSLAIKPEVSVRRSGTECRDILYYHRALEDDDIYYFLNTARIAREVKIAVRCDKIPYRLDPDTGSISAIADCSQKGGRTFIKYKFHSHESLLVVFTDELILPAVQHKCENRYELALVDNWEFSTKGYSCITLTEWKLDTSIQQDGVYIADVDIDFVPKELHLVIEDFSSSDELIIEINGTEVKSSGWITDVSMVSYDISKRVKEGSNRVAIKGPDANNPKARLMGSFSSDINGAVILPPRNTIRSGSWTDQGYPFFSGTATYSQDVEIPQLLERQRVFLRVDAPAHSVEFLINGTEAGKRLWPPYGVDVTSFIIPGVNRIEIRITNTSANAMLQEPRLSGLIGGARLIICS